jgi:phosphoesterase RecJ-like protein
VVVLTHAKPDGDAAGSTLALCRALRHRGIDASVWYVGPLPRWLKELARDTPVRELVPGRPLQPADPPTAGPLDASPPDAAVILDTGSWSQLAEVRPWLESSGVRRIVIDHHLHGDGNSGQLRLIRPTDASTAQVLEPVCTRLLGCEAGSLPVDVAEPLYLGTATDTGWFRLSNVKPATLEHAAALLRAGVDHTRLYEIIEQRDSAGRWRLLGRALSSLELHDSRRIALMQLTLRDFQLAGADRNDTSGFADMLLTIETVRVAAVISEGEVGPGEPPMTKVSMRSKPGADAVDVNAATIKLGGGGHARAAGVKMPGVTMAEARRRVLEALGPKA